jgi:hypothetical protein
MSEQIEAVAAADMDEADVVEVVGLFENRHTFDCAVEALLTGGFQRTAISVLASHTSLEASAPNPAAPQDDALTALVGELSYAFPLESAGLLTVVGGPISGSIGALMAAGIGGMALKEYLDELTSHPDTDAFAKALEEGGLVIWVQVADDAEEAKAGEILSAEGAVNVHLSRRVE